MPKLNGECLLLLKEKTHKMGCGLKSFGYATMHYLERNLWLVLMLVVLVLGLALRYSLVPYVSSDLINYVFPWMKTLSEPSQGLGGNGFLYIVNDSFTPDQEPFYMMILGILAQLPAGPSITSYAGGDPFPLYYAYYVKSVSFVFDIFIALGAFAIFDRLTKDKMQPAMVFCVVFLLPVVVVNSAMWGQIDSYYTCFLVWSIYFLVSGHPIWSVVFLGLGISAKPQGIFFLPFFLYLWLERKMKFRWLLLAPLVILLTYSPYWFMGGSFTKPFEWVFLGFGEYGGLNYGAGNIWAFFHYYTNDNTANMTNTLMSTMSVLVGLTVLIAMVLIIHGRHLVLDSKALIGVAAVFALATPFFLSKMHERYFYLFDVFVVIYAFALKRRYWLIVLKEFSSIIGYSSFMFSRDLFSFMSYDDNIIVSAMINAFILVVVLYDLRSLPYKSKAEREKDLAYLADKAEEYKNGRK